MGDTKGRTASLGDAKGRTASLGDTKGRTASLGDTKGRTASLGDAKGRIAPLGDAKGRIANVKKGMVTIMISATERQSIASMHEAKKAILERNTAGFTVLLDGVSQDTEPIEYLAKKNRPLADMISVYMTGGTVRTTVNRTAGTTSIAFTNMIYRKEDPVDVVMSADGWDGFHRAYSMSRMARYANTAFVIRFTDEEALLFGDDPAEYLVERLPSETDRADALYGDPQEYGQRCRYQQRSVWPGLVKNEYVFWFFQKQFESFGLRIGLQAELCRLNHSLFKGGDLTDREKVLEINRWICDNITYLNNEEKADHSAAVTFLRRKGVCQGIASLVTSMLQIEGIPVLYVRGNISSESSHGWNLVKVDGEWLHLDCTWGIPYGAGHPYLLRRDGDFPDHTWDKRRYGRAANDKIAVSLERINCHEFEFCEGEQTYLVDRISISDPNAVPVIKWCGNTMTGLTSMFRYLKIGYRIKDGYLSFCFHDREYVFPVSDGSGMKKCPALLRDGEIYVSQNVLNRLPGFECSVADGTVKVRVEAGIR